MNGAELLEVLKHLPEEELQTEAADLVAAYSGRVCLDCFQHHETPWEAFVCDERIDARARRNASRSIRQRELRDRRQLVGAR